MMNTSDAGGGQPWWYDYAVKLALVVAGAGAAFVAVHLAGYAEKEKVPFTGRTHLVALSHRTEREYDERGFTEFKEEDASKSKKKKKILDPSHPDSVRVRRIAGEIIAAARKALVVVESRQELVDLVDGLEWEVVVVRDFPDFAVCFPGAGKIIVSSLLLLFFHTDAEIAFNIAHEVAHVVARHGSEMIYLTKRIQGLLPLSLLMIPFFHRDEFEADYIGMLLHTAAGYDPHAVLEVWRKCLNTEEAMKTTMTMTMRLRRLLKFYPSNKKRLQLLSQPKVMEEALGLYARVSTM